MTREEYNTKYGVAPVFTTPSEIDTEPTFSSAPVQMTQAEYDFKYSDNTEQTADDLSAKTFDPIFPSKEDDTIIQSGLKATGNVIPSALNLGKGLLSAAFSPIDTIKSVGSIVKGGAEKGTREVLERTGFEEQADSVTASESEQAFNQVTQFMKDNYFGLENLERTAVNDPFGVGIDILGLLTGGATLAGKAGKLDKAAVAGKVDSAISKTAGAVTKPTAAAINKAKEFVVKGPNEIITKRANDIFDIESGYAKNRRINDQANDAGNASRQRIASTDVMVNAVDENGLIRTKQKGGAVDQYRKQTVEGFEGVVRQNLEREGALVNLEEVRRALLQTINGDGKKGSGLEGSDLVSALRKIDREIEGLGKRADDFGNVPLAKIQDSKIATTKNIDYTKPTGVTYRKLVARAYKELIEKKSKTNVKEVNVELGKFYDDIARLENLDGRRVQGGKLGKHFAQVTGNIAGAAAGSFAGPLGTLAGTVVGGEVSSMIKGKTLGKTFGKELGLEGKVNPVLEKAMLEGKKAKVTDLKKPDGKVRAAKGVPKTEEIVKLERQIDNNIKQQKKAIAAKDFTLVKGLKEIYNALVEGLVESIRRPQEKLPKTPKIEPVKNKTTKKKVVSHRTDISQPTDDFLNYIKSSDKFEEAMAQLDVITNELSVAGKRLFKSSGIGGSSTSISQKSTFPKWIPSDLRSKDLMQKTLSLLENNKIPPVNAIKQQRLYNEFMNYIGDVTGNTRADFLELRSLGEVSKQLEDINVIPKLADTPKTKGAIPETNLLKEAKKFDSAEEFVKAQGQTMFRGQEKKGVDVDFNTTGFQGNTEGGVFFTPTKDTAKKYGDNVIERISNNKNTVSVKEADELQTMATKQVNSDIKNSIESNEQIEQMALGRPKGFAEYTNKPFIETGDGFGEVGELIYYKDIDKNPLTKSQLEQIWKDANK